MKKYCLIFDVDGTLVNSNAGFVPAITEMFQELFQLSIREKEIYEHINDHITAILEFFVPHSSPDERKKAISFYRYRYQEKYSRHISLYPDVKDTLSALSKIAYIGTATNLPSEHVTKLFHHFELNSFFDNPKGTDANDKAKPSPDILYSTLDSYTIPPENSYMIGDSENDIYAGKNAGIQTIAIDYSKSKVFQSKPDFLIHSFAELRTFFQE